MGGEAVGPEGTGRRLATALIGGRCQLVEEGSASWIECRQDLLGGLGDGYERTSGGLRERPEELNDELLSQGRHQPAERCLLDAGHDVERHLDGDAVIGCGWIERVVDAERTVAPRPLVGIGIETVDATTEVAAAEEFLDAQIERIGVVSGMVFPPGGEVANRDDVFGNAVVERVCERVLVDGDVTSKTIAERLDLGEHRLIMGDEGVLAAVPTVLNQRMTDEEFSGEDWIDALQVHLAVRDRWQAVERGPFITHRRAAILVPPGIGVLPTQEVRRAPLEPLRIDRGDHAGAELVRLDQLRRHDPGRCALLERRTASQDETGIASAPIDLLLAVVEPDLGEQARQQRLVNGIRRCRLLIKAEAEAGGDVAKLAMDVLPLPNPQEVQVLVAAHRAEAVAAAFVAFGLDVAPQLQPRHEIGVLIGVASVQLCGALGGAAAADSGGPNARILHRQTGDDDRDFGDTTMVLCLEQHASQLRVDRDRR